MYPSQARNLSSKKSEESIKAGISVKMNHARKTRALEIRIQECSLNTKLQRLTTHLKTNQLVMISHKIRPSKGKFLTMLIKMKKL